MSIKLCNVEKGKGPENEVRCFDSLLGRQSFSVTGQGSKGTGQEELEWLSLY